MTTSPGHTSIWSTTAGQRRRFALINIVFTLESWKRPPHRFAWLRYWPFLLRDCAWLRENDFIFAWLRESTCVRDAWKRRKMCVISWNHSKTCVISWKACFSSNFSVFAWKSQFFIDCVNAWKWKKICVIAWLGTFAPGGPFWLLLRPGSTISLIACFLHLVQLVPSISKKHPSNSDQISRKYFLVESSISLDLPSYIIKDCN